MKIEITEEVLRDGTNEHRRGDQITARDAEHEAKLREWVRVGWAKDVDTGEQGERKPGAQRLHVHDVVQNQN